MSYKPVRDDYHNPNRRVIRSMIDYNVNSFDNGPLYVIFLDEKEYRGEMIVLCPHRDKDLPIPLAVRHVFKFDFLKGTLSVPAWRGYRRRRDLKLYSSSHGLLTSSRYDRHIKSDALELCSRFHMPNNYDLICKAFNDLYTSLMTERHLLSQIEAESDINT